MKSAKERQRDYRERRKEQKNAGLIKLKVLTSAAIGKKLDALSEIDGTDVGRVLGQAVELLWTQRFGAAGIAVEKAIEPEQVPEPEKEKKKKPEKGKKKEAKSRDAKARPRTKTIKDKPETLLVATI